VSQNRADRSLAVVAPNGLFVYRTKLFGGITAEVTTQFNGSNLMETLKGTQIRNPLDHFTDRLSLSAGHSVIPVGGLEPGVQILVGDSAYHRVSNEWKGHFYLPTKLPEDRSNPEVSKIFLLPRQLLTRQFRRPI